MGARMKKSSQEAWGRAFSGQTFSRNRADLAFLFVVAALTALLVLTLAGVASLLFAGFLGGFLLGGVFVWTGYRVLGRVTGSVKGPLWLEKKNERDANAFREAGQPKTDALAFLSHELRTPLSAVIGFAELLQDERVGPLNPKQRGYVRDIRESGEHLLLLANDLLDLSKLEAGKLTLSRRVTDASVVAAGALTLLREGATKRGVLLNVALPEPAPLLFADPLKLKQVLLNLLANAVAFTPPGGRVTLSLGADADAVTFTVADTGVGIAEEDVEGLFEPFVQVSERLGGAGLGLALSKTLVELHGGELRVRSAPGKGSTFSFVLPRGLNKGSSRRVATEDAPPASGDEGLSEPAPTLGKSV